MKTFKDLEFKNTTQSDYGISTRAQLTFDNGYGVSVITGKFAASTPMKPYELAVTKHNGEGNYILTYDTHITNDVVGYLTEKQVTDLMQQIQEL